MKIFLALALTLSTMAAAQAGLQGSLPVAPPTQAQQTKANAIAQSFTGRTCKLERMEVRDFTPKQYLNGSAEKERAASNMMIDLVAKDFRSSGLKTSKDTKTETGSYIYIQSPDMKKMPVSIFMMHDFRKTGGISISCELK